ncbi:Outer-membrane lipoprotein carrier protein [Thalassocella blandensis]|nr:Outer-membrane lipoprotein carrier protein [Thalassocella blandensis]
MRFSLVFTGVLKCLILVAGVVWVSTLYADDAEPDQSGHTFSGASSNDASIQSTLSQSAASTSSATTTNIQTFLKKNEALQGRFEQTKSLSGMPFPLKSSGVFRIANANYLLWDIKTPIQSRMEINVEMGTFLVDGKKMDAAAEQNAATNVIGEIIVALFTSDWETLQQYFVLQSEANTAPENTAPTETGTWHMVLTPKSEALLQVIQRVDIAGERFIEKVKLLDQQSDVTQIEFFDVQPIRTDGQHPAAVEKP